MTRWWLLAVLSTCALVFVRDARADGPSDKAADSADVTVVKPPPPPTPAAEVPAITEPPNLESYAGQRVARVEVRLSDASWTDVKAPAVTAIKAGEVLTAAGVRALMREALRSGAFASARVELEPEGGSVRVTLWLMPRKIMESVRIDLHGAPLDAQEVLRAADLVEEGELVLGRMALYQRRVGDVLRRHGFPSPRVTLTTRATDDPLRVILFVDADPGAPLRVERRLFYPVRGTTEDLRPFQRAYVVQAGDRADEVALGASDNELELLLRKKGYHRAEVSHDVIVHRGIMTLRVRVDFGTRYDVRYEGNARFDASTLDEALALEEETDRSPSHLSEKIRDFYVKRGFLDAEVRLEQRGTPADPVTFLVFHVRENARVQVRQWQFPCLRDEDVKKMEGSPPTSKDVVREIDSYLVEELPGDDLLAAPSSSGVDALTAGPDRRGARPDPTPLEPTRVYAPETYERAVQHVQELYRSAGFLSAQVGPVQVLRRRCDPRSPPGTCRPLEPQEAVPDVCQYDRTGLPRPLPALPPSQSCAHEPENGVTCEPAVALRIPIQLGPRTQLYDVAFSGVRSTTPKKLAEVADVKLGEYVNGVKLDEARRRVADAYREEGYAFVDVRYALELSPDRTRARVRFIVAESEQVIVRNIVIRGNEHTNTSAITRRIALEVGQPYRASDIRKTEERIATLGTFASVNVALDNPYVPGRNKTVIITVIELPRQYTELQPGFSTGEGFRLASEYGHRNLTGNGIALTLRLQLAYIPTPFIIDPVARENYAKLDDEDPRERIGARLTASTVFPEVGLGPLVRTGVDALYVHDLLRDFYITKIAGIPNLTYRPINEVAISLFQSVEYNNVSIFREGNISAYLASLTAQGRNTIDLQRLLLVPDGKSYAIAQRLLVTWDRRDNAFNASRGTYFVTGIEHVDAYPVDIDITRVAQQSHFLKFTETFGGYIPLPKGLRIAALTRIGANVQLTSTSVTYPDRLFFMGGVDSMRGWNFNSFIPQDDIDRITADEGKPDLVPNPNANQTGQPDVIANPDKFTDASRPVRGGNLMVNERVELRIPIRGVFETVVFGDFGNLWIDPRYPFERREFPIRAAVGSGLRIQTPVGPFAIDYGFNVTRKRYEAPGAINFAIGLF